MVLDRTIPAVVDGESWKTRDDLGMTGGLIVLAGAPVDQPTVVGSWNDLSPFCFIDSCRSTPSTGLTERETKSTICQKFVTWVGYRVWENGHQNAAFVLEFILVGWFEKLVPHN